MKLVVGYLATPGGADAMALGVRLARTLGAEVEACIVLPPDGRTSAVAVATTRLRRAGREVARRGGRVGARRRRRA